MAGQDVRYHRNGAGQITKFPKTLDQGLEGLKNEGKFWGQLFLAISI